MRNQQKAIQALQRAVADFPHLRVGQVIENAMLTVPGGIPADLFYIGDEALAKALDAYRASAGGKAK